MPQYFTHYWRNETWDEEAAVSPAGTPIVSLGSGQFLDRGVQSDDYLYAITVKQGKLLLCCRVRVAEVCDVPRAKRILGVSDLYGAPQQAIAAESTPALWNNQVSDTDTAKLTFIDSAGLPKPLVFVTTGQLDQQTLRGVRRLTVTSALILDSYLPAPVTIDLPEVEMWASDDASASTSDETEYESFADGKKDRKYVSFYERNPKNRKEAIAFHGLTCKACAFNFEAKYGARGKDFIHVHHVVPVSQYEKPKAIDPATDLTVLCPNCHAMIHRDKKRTLTVSELQATFLY